MKSQFKTLTFLSLVFASVVSWAEMGIDNNSREGVIRQLYSDFNRTWCNPSQLPTYFVADISKATQLACDRGLFGMEIDGPIIPGNDYDLKEIVSTLQVECDEMDPTACGAVFKSFGEQYRITYLFQEHEGRHLIMDILDAMGVSFRQALKAALK